jgi:hypothetical protein
MMTRRSEYRPMLIGKERKKYTVWIDDVEMTDKFVTYAHAKMMHTVYESRGYKKVIIQEGRDNE